MPTDYACQAAAEQAARGIAPVRAVLVPAQRPAPPAQEEAVPVFIRSFLAPEQPDAAEDDIEGQTAAAYGGPVEPVSASMGAAVLLALLDGLQAHMTGRLVDWYSRLPLRVPQALEVPGVAGPDSSGRRPGGWQAMADLQHSAQEVLTVMAGRPRGNSGGPAELQWHLALVEDIFAGALRRTGIPPAISVRSASELAGAAGSLFGINRTGPPPQQPGQQAQHAESHRSRQAR